MIRDDAEDEDDGWMDDDDGDDDGWLNDAKCSISWALAKVSKPQKAPCLNLPTPPPSKSTQHTPDQNDQKYKIWFKLRKGYVGVQIQNFI